MKALFATFALILPTTSAHAAVPFTILEATVSPGFVANPESRDFYLQDDGKLTLEITALRTGQKTVRELGTLSEEAVRSLLARVNAIDPKAKLVDSNEGQPRCTDTPFVSTYAFVKNQRVELTRSAGCHSWALQYGEGASLASYAAFFLNL